MKLLKVLSVGVVLSTSSLVSVFAQNSANVDVNLNIKHSVGGVSDFGRDRHITMHASLYENAWEGEVDKAEILFNEWDVQLGRDNGIASFLHQFSPEDENNRNHHDPDSLTVLLDFWKGEYDQRIQDRGLSQFKSEQTKGAIMGTNAHPTYPTLSYFDNGLSGSSWGRENGFVWMPRDIETSAEWVSQYMEDFFVDNASQEGVPIPEYWEVMNEPDFELNTGQFMMSSWEDIIEYHNLVAQGVREKLGSRAPKIGGMTWGLHDLFRGDGFSRFRDPNYVANFYGTTAADQVAIDYARGQVDTPLFALPSDTDWYQWDVIWKEFIDRAGENMDFYAVHFYDWPRYQNNGGQRRSGGHVEATLEMLEWYDVFKYGENNRKPVIISEYGAVANAWDPMPHDTRYDWENLKPFSAMMMQFLERPDYVELSMPFHLLKAQFRDIDNNGDGIPEVVYHYKTLRDDDGDGEWEFSELTKWYELWDDVDGTRIDTKSSDPDIQVDSYVDGNDVYLILNNLVEEETSIALNFFEDNNNNPTSVRIKHLFLEGVRDIILADNTTSSIPSSVTLKPEATMVLKYTFASPVVIDETSVENKFFGEPVSNNQRVNIQGGDNTFFVNNVTVPSNPSQTEAIVKMTVTLFDAPQTENGFLSLNKFEFNGVELDVPFDWRGGQQFRSKWFGVLEIPVPASLIQTNNSIVVDFQHVGEVNIVNMITWDFSKVPGRSTGAPDVPDPIAVTGVNVTPASLSLNVNQTSTLSATISPSNATNKSVSWSTNNASVATVNSSGIVTAVAAGTATITGTTVDGSFTDTTVVTVTGGNNGGGGDPDPAGETIVIEAETFTNTGGTFNDASSGGSGLGVNNNGTTINFVNSGDFADYTINVGIAGDYDIEYLISTPSDNAQIQLTIDNIVVDTTNIPNNGSWDDYRTIDGSGTISLTTGVKTVRITASGSEQWQWNLDKITLTKTDDNNNTVAVTGVSLTPANATLDIGDTQNLSAIVAPSNATNQTVSFSSSNTNIATVNGSGVVSAIAAGTATITVTTADGNRTDTTSITVNPVTSGQTPFANHVIPGQIEFEDFDNGGQGVAYNDADASNNGNSYRTNEGVDIQPASEGGFNIGWTSNGEWLEYTVNVPTAGNYDVDIRYASRTKDGIIRILSDGTDKTGNIDLPTTGGWQSYQTVTTSVNLSAGSQVLRVEIIENGINLNFMSFEAAGGNNGGGGTPSTLVIEAEDFNNTGGTFNDAFAGGPGLGVNDNATNINYVNSGDFAEYTINVPVGGTFDIEYLISTPSDNAQIQLVIDGVTVDTTNVPNNGSWDSFGTVDGGTFTLSSGNHDVRINASGSNQWQWNLDKVTLSPASASKSINVTADLNVSPNPASSIANVNGLISGEAYTYQLLNVNGALVATAALDTSNNTIDVSNLSSGMYFINIISSTDQKVIKLIVSN